MPMQLTEQRLVEAFNIITAAAIAGERCPENGRETGLRAELVSALARAGKVRVEVSGRNYRTVHVLVGDAAGKSTKPDPAGAKVWKIIDADGNRNITGTAPAPRHQPSLANITAFDAR